MGRGAKWRFERRIRVFWSRSSPSCVTGVLLQLASVGRVPRAACPPVLNPRAINTGSKLPVARVAVAFRDNSTRLRRRVVGIGPEERIIHVSLRSGGVE